jgi:hypothetical protein
VRNLARENMRQEGTDVIHSTYSRPEGSLTTPSSFSFIAKKAKPSLLVPAEARPVNTDNNSKCTTDRIIFKKLNIVQYCIPSHRSERAIRAPTTGGVGLC